MSDIQQKTTRAFVLEISGRRYANSKETIRTIEGDMTLVGRQVTAADIGSIITRLFADHAADISIIGEVAISISASK